MMSECKNIDFVNVAVRIRPSPNEQEDSVVQIIRTDPPAIYLPERNASFGFDNIFEEDATQETVYNDMVNPLVKQVLSGYNATIFAYGQTGTGKTFTIGSDPSYQNNADAGLITRALNDIMSSDEGKLVTISISFVEIYNEKVYDLLSDSKAALQLKGFNITGLTKQKVLTAQDAKLLLIQGGRNRHTSETKQNNKSSRSHAIFTIYCNVKNNGQETLAKLNLVDLAGSESVKRTGNEGSQFQEGININKGLLYIGLVINALSNNQSYVPYRQSTITTILQDSLNKNNYITLISCISTNNEDVLETVQTLAFAQRAKKLKNHPELNSIIGEYHNEYVKHHEVRNINTPYKTRPMSSPLARHLNMRTPLKQKMFNMPSSKLYTSNMEASGSTSLLSGSTPSLAPIHELNGSSLSPIINKCFMLMENKFLAHLSTIISTPAPAAQNSPRISRRSLEREVKKIVQSNMHIEPDFCTFRNEINSNGDTSAHSSDDHREAEKENATAPIVLLDASVIKSGNKTPFKIPQVPKRRGRPTKVVAASSPIEIEIEEPRPVRRSTRLSKILTPPSAIRRRSMRLSMLRRTPEKQPAINLPSKTKSKKVSTKRAHEDVDHVEHILSIINTGTIKQLTQLHTIGVKTAAMIHQYRQLKGPIRKIADLRAMPWRGNGFKQFLVANFIPNGAS